ncbi:uncharacterized protein si:ch211-168f7.5 [Corythoichthys intestinalis]|uniref:uncharacterized protein si:ch211-168f7.5 n=1 Tax=Corythoichthys intestinalis TaxID=161448 RepID=UPI0025A50D69|nr:uncharacterized protein si:ch211-168f7.5 [Corythoichthys intestinalis]
MAAGRRGCVNSLWSGSERVRIGERLKATLAGVLELELLRCEHHEMVDAALEDRAKAAEAQLDPAPDDGNGHQEAERGPATLRGQQAPSPSDTIGLSNKSNPDNSCSNSGDGTVHSSLGGRSNSRWSSLSWDAPSDLLSPPTPDPGGAVNLDSDSRPSSGFYSVSGSSLSDSCYSVSSDAAQGVLVQATRPIKLWEQVPCSVSNTDILWSDCVVQQTIQNNQRNDAEPTEEQSMSVSSEPEASGLSFLSDLCSDHNHSLIYSLLKLDRVSLSSHALRPQLDPCYCEDLVSRRTKEVYSYPSPLHAVALQSPLFTSQMQERAPSPHTEGNQVNEPTESVGVENLPHQHHKVMTPASLTQLEQYISRLAHQYRHRSSDLAHCPVIYRGLSTPGKSHGSTQSLSAFESRSTHSTLPGGSVTPCKSLMGNSAKVSLSATGKNATRNSINLGSLPSATGEDLNINLNLNLNLNLAPSLNSKRGILEKPQNLGIDSPTSVSSVLTQPLSTPGPALRARPRISTCPTSLNHRSSLEITSGPGATSGFGSSTFSQSLDWTGGQSNEVGTSVFGTSFGSAPGSQRSSLLQEPVSSPKLIEDSPMVGEISRLSGLSRAVVVGLMEQGVEMDIDCFRAEAASEVKKHKGPLKAHTEHPHDCIRLTDPNPQRPMQLSLSVTHSPQSQSSLTPPLSHSSSPIHPYQSIHSPSSVYTTHSHYQRIPSPSDPPSSPTATTAQRAHSPPRPLQPSPMGGTPLSVFRRDAPFQCSLPRTIARTSPAEYVSIHSRSGSLRHSGGGGGTGLGWTRVEGDGLYRGKHASHKLVRAATVSNYANRDDYGASWWEDKQAQSRRKTSNKLSRAFEGRFWGKDTQSKREEMDRVEYGYGWTRNIGGSWRGEQRREKVVSSTHDKMPKVESSPIFSKQREKEGLEKRSSSVRSSRRALFRSESQGLLVPRNQDEPTRRSNWVSSFDLAQSAMSVSRDEGERTLSAKEDKHLSSTASLFNLSCSQSFESSCHSLSPLSSPSFSPSPPPRLPLQRSRSLRDLGRRVFGSVRSLSLKQKSSKK